MNISYKGAIEYIPGGLTKSYFFVPQINQRTFLSDFIFQHSSSYFFWQWLCKIPLHDNASHLDCLKRLSVWFLCRLESRAKDYVGSPCLLLLLTRCISNFFTQLVVLCQYIWMCPFNLLYVFLCLKFSTPTYSRYVALILCSSNCICMICRSSWRILSGIGTNWEKIFKQPLKNVKWWSWF